MATKRKRSKTTKQPKKPTVIDLLPKNQEEYLERLIESSQRCITGESESLDELFSNQVNKLRKELEELRKSK